MCLCDVIITYPQKRIFIPKRVRDIVISFWAGVPENGNRDRLNDLIDHVIFKAGLKDKVTRAQVELEIINIRA
jgi:hypothetical protein